MCHVLPSEHAVLALTSKQEVYPFLQGWDRMHSKYSWQSYHDMEEIVRHIREKISGLDRLPRRSEEKPVVIAEKGLNIQNESESGQ